MNQFSVMSKEGSSSALTATKVVQSETNNSREIVEQFIASIQQLADEVGKASTVIEALDEYSTSIASVGKCYSGYY